MQSSSLHYGTVAIGIVSLCLGCAPSEEERERIKGALREEIGVSENRQDLKAEPPPSQGIQDQVEKTWVTESSFSEEQWEIQYIGNEPVGYIHRRIERAANQEPGIIRLLASSRTQLRSQGKKVVQKVDLVVFEKENGELARFEGTVEIGSRTRRLEGLPREGKLLLRNNRDGQVDTVTIAWSPSDRGPFAIEQSLIRSPMREGEVRQVRYFDPVMGKPIDVQLKAYDYFDIPTFNGKKEKLLEIEITSFTGDGASSSQIWVDRKGRGFKTYLPGVDLRSFRCDKESAMVVVDQSELSELPLRPVNLYGSAIDPSAVGPIRYRVETIDSDYKMEIPSRTHQVVRTIKDRRIDVIAYPASLLNDSIEDLEKESVPSAEALADSFIIDTDHPQVQGAAEEFLRIENITATEPVVRRAAAFSRGISDRIETIPFDREVSDGHSTLAAGKGDCFDHAALLTAVCRSNAIPARIAIGLRCDTKVRPLAMTLHAWTEIHDGVRWIPFDSSIQFNEDERIAADRIKWVDSMWNTINPYDSILQLAKHLSMLKITVMRSVP